MKIQRNGTEYELTFDEIEQAYREQKRYYLMEDVKSLAEDNEIKLSEEALEEATDRAERAIDNNDSLWDCYWRNIDYGVSMASENKA